MDKLPEQKYECKYSRYVEIVSKIDCLRIWTVFPNSILNHIILTIFNLINFNHEPKSVVDLEIQLLIFFSWWKVLRKWIYLHLSAIVLLFYLLLFIIIITYNLLFCQIWITQLMFSEFSINHHSIKFNIIKLFKVIFFVLSTIYQYKSFLHEDYTLGVKQFKVNTNINNCEHLLNGVQ